MLTIEYDVLLDAAYAADLEEDNLYPDYSGRGMFGDTCLGLTHDTSGDVSRFLRMLAVELRATGMDDDEVETLIIHMENSSRGDGMGRSVITYWPRVQAVNVPAVEDRR